MITLEQLTNYVDGLQERYIREHLIPANAILMPRWGRTWKNKLKNQVITSIPNNEFCFMGLEIIQTMEDEFKLITIYKEKK